MVVAVAASRNGAYSGGVLRPYDADARRNEERDEFCQDQRAP